MKISGCRVGDAELFQYIEGSFYYNANALKDDACHSDRAENEGERALNSNDYSLISSRFII